MSPDPLHKSPPPEEDAPKPKSESFRRVAVMAAIFCVVAAGVLLFTRVQSPSHDPLGFEEMAAAKKALHDDPTSESLKSRIRELDLEFREQYFRKLRLNRVGGVLLLLGAAVFLISAKRSAPSRKAPPPPAPDESNADEFQNVVRRNTRGAAAVAGLAGIAMLAIGLAARPKLPPLEPAARVASEAPAAEAETVRTPPASPEEFARNWPRFRGPGGNGVAFWTNAPTHWDRATGEGIAWKTQVPLPGFGSPVVWDRQVFLSGGEPGRCEVYSFDTETGEILWQRTVESIPSPNGEAKTTEQTGYAAPTVAVDGRRVYALFANGDLAAFGFDGAPIWTKHLGAPENPYGHSTSLLTRNEVLFVQFDQGHEPGGRSTLYAFQGATGEIVWQQRRDVPSSWATPIVIEPASGPQLITLGEPWVCAYDPNDGRELWRVECMGSDVAPSPIFAGGLVIAASPWREITAIRPDGSGNATETSVAWTIFDNVPDITSPVSNGELLYTVTTDGYLAAFDMKDQTMVWDHGLDLEMNASPTLVGGLLYLFSTEGTVVMVRDGRVFEEAARAELGEPVFASPAFVRGSIFVRAEDHLYRLGGPPTEELAAAASEAAGQAQPQSTRKDS